MKTTAINNPQLREFSLLNIEQQKMKRIVHDQEVKMQMRCDFIIEPASSDENRATRDKSGQPILKYKQMTHQFLQQQKELNQKLAMEYK